VFHRPIDSDLPSDADREEPARRQEDDRFVAARRQMVEEQLWDRDIIDPRVLKVMDGISREGFVPAELRKHAYEDHPLPIGFGQTISQPYIVALMAQLAAFARRSRVGGGSRFGL